MKTFSANMISRLYALLAALALALAQGSVQAQPAYVFSQQELDQILAPIALYPDALLAQILMASTYPLEVSEAARWAREHRDLSGDDAVRAAEGEDWDPSVKSLVAFPQVLERMGENPQWTQALGDAFLDQQPQVMDTVQGLRRRAEAAGNLRSDDRLRVYDSGAGLMVEQYNPEFIYVPYYDPLVVYGSWWWPAYPPFHWRPWSGYYAQPGFARGYYWGPPIGISAGFFFGAFDWPRHHVRVAHVDSYYYRHSVIVNRTVIANRTPGAWRHEPEHRRGVAYRGIEAQQRFGAASAAQGQGNLARPARRADERIEARPGVPPAIRPGSPAEGRRPDARPGPEPRANVPPAPLPAPAVQAAPVLQPAPAEPRFERRRDSRSTVQLPPTAQSSPGQQPAPAEPRFERGRDQRSTVQPPPAAQSSPGRQPAPGEPGFERRRDQRSTVQPPPAAQSAPRQQPASAEMRFDHRRDTRSAPQPAPAAPVMQPAPVVRPAPVLQSAPAVRSAPVIPAVAPPAAQPAPAPGGNRQAAPRDSGAHRESRQAGEPAAEFHPDQGSARRNR